MSDGKSIEPTDEMPSDKKSPNPDASSKKPDATVVVVAPDEAPQEEKAEDDEKNLVPLSQVFRYADCFDKFLMIFGGICAFINGAGMPAFSEVFGRLVNELATGGANVEEQVTVAAKLMVYVGLVVMLLSAIQVMTWMTASERQASVLGQAVFGAIMRQDAEFFDKRKPGELAMLMSKDITIVKNATNDKIAIGIMNFGMFLFGFGFGFYRSWRLTLVMLATFPLIAGTAIAMTIILTNIANESQKSYGVTGEISEEVLQNVRTVQAFGQEEREALRYEGALDGPREEGIRKAFVEAIGIGASYGIIFGSYSAAFGYSAFLVEHGHNNVGEIIATFFAVLMGSFGIGQALTPIGALAEARGACWGMFEIIERNPIIDNRQEGKKLADFQGHVEFKKVKFSYPTKLQDKLFTDLNLSIEAGKTVAFSGASGCGKSSIIALLQRLYDPQEGELLIDGVNLKDIDLSWWRDRVGVVAQESNLFSGSVRENVRMGRVSATDAEIEEACKQANIHETIMSLPEGYDTSVGAAGSQLSGGQKQRIAIARAIVKNPDFLILDEATSALDRKSEVEVQKALDALCQGRKRTTVVIAHRLVTIRNADTIFFVTHDDVTGSEIAESGTYDQLVAKGGAFADMVSKQAKSIHTDAEEEAEDEEVSAGLKNVSFTHTPGVSHGKIFESIDERAEAEVQETEADVGKLIALSSDKQWAVAIGIVGSLISGGLYPGYAVVLSKMLTILGTRTPAQIKEQSTLWVCLFLVIGFGAFLGWCLQGFYSIAGEALTQRLRGKLFRAILRQDGAFFDAKGHDVGGLGGRLNRDCEQVHQLWGPSLGFKVQALCNLIVGITIACIFQWQLALVTLACVPIMIATGAIQQAVLVGFSNRAGETSMDDSVAGESLTNIRTVIAFNAMERRCAAYQHEAETRAASGKFTGVIAGIAFGITQFSFYGVFALAFWYGGKLMAQNKATFEDVMIASMCVLMGAMGAGEAGGFASKVMEAGGATKRVFSIIERSVDIDPDDDAAKKDFGFGAEIAFHHVNFVYPSRPKAKVLRGYESTYKNQTQVGLIGSTGCGKSTILSMLMRFYEPVTGAITINGHNLKDLNLRQWRNQTSIVLQEPSLFSGSIMENIRYSRPEATDDECIEAAKLACIHEETIERTEGYNFDVGYKGRNLSGGQKQRVAIARGLLRNPRLLLLDEATSALDNATEAKVIENIAAKVKEHPMTIVSIAHRLTTIRHATKIVLLDEGVVLEEGSHDELMAKGGDYKHRWELYQAGMQ